MSRNFRMTVTISEPLEKNKSKILKYMQTLGLDLLDESKDYFQFSGDINLGGGMMDSEWCREVTYKIWRLNDDYCQVEIQSVYLDNLPFETFMFDEEDYREWEDIYRKE